MEKEIRDIHVTHSLVFGSDNVNQNIFYGYYVEGKVFFDLRNMFFYTKFELDCKDAIILI